MSLPAAEIRVRNVDELEVLNGAPSDGVKRKVLTRIDPHARRFIARSPFLLLASGSATGTDCSPRGDAPGFVQVVDETTLLIPERPGNRRADSLRNVHPVEVVGSDAAYGPKGISVVGHDRARSDQWCATPPELARSVDASLAQDYRHNLY